MTVTIAVRFPLGRYHATPWDRSVNEGAVEWPPSPWRLLRTLVATWYHRWPDLPAPALDELLTALGDPPSYHTPPTRTGHTRHYLPDLDHHKGKTGSTGLALDPYLSLPRDAELLVQWPTTITDEQRQVLAKLVELVPYLGRAESVCDMRLQDTDPTPDDTWWQPSATGAETVRLLAPQPPIRRPILELSTVDMRQKRKTVPPDTTWVSYARTPTRPPAPADPVPETTNVTAIRWAVMSRAPLKATHGILLADAVHRRITRALDGGRRDLVGHKGAATDHQHAHWLPLPNSRTRAAHVTTMLSWIPAGLTAAEVTTFITEELHHLSGRLGGDDGYETKGFPPVDLLLQAAGTIQSVAPELCGPARTWISLTPYLPVRHRKGNRPINAYLTEDIHTELAYRGQPPATVTTRFPDQGLPDRWSLEFRRYRQRERLNNARPGLALHIEFHTEVQGPVVLGQLSHFGYGIFVPDRPTQPDPERPRPSPK